MNKPKLSLDEKLHNQIDQARMSGYNINEDNFSNGEKIHDWRKYIDSDFVEHWKELTWREKGILFIQAQRRAADEEWD